MGQSGHRLISDQERWLGGHRAGKFELAHFDLGEIARQASRLFAKADFVEELGTSLFNLVRGMMAAAPPRHGVEQGDPYIVGESETDERPRQLETSR